MTTVLKFSCQVRGGSELGCVVSRTGSVQVDAAAAYESSICAAARDERRTRGGAGNWVGELVGRRGVWEDQKK